ncbi:hypothetical protein P3C29_15285 [Pseudomonas sp. 1912-s]|uniref:hypothetical protein n=1 Tax=Pseudomonas sp. 1912-s TaxID=3033802 RepID=UPI0023E042CF|nr:hypothetical protein [Pseudomonas sp. 1912-s]MDF3200050.1 hypothetical protein [Pseudomonas sp. 1912-s]
MQRIIALCLLSALLVGCSTSAVPTDRAKQVGADKTYSYQATPATPYGTLTVVRDSGFISSGCDMGIYVDGKLAARLATKERAIFKIPAGEIVLGAGVIGSGLCGTAADRREREVSLSPGQTKNYRVFTSSEADIDILPNTL